MFEKMKIRYYIGLILLMVVAWQVAIRDVMPKELENIIAIFPLELSAVLFFGYYFYKQKINLNTVVYDHQDYKWRVPSLIGIVLIFNTFSLTTYCYPRFLFYFGTIHRKTSPWKLPLINCTDDKVHCNWTHRRRIHLPGTFVEPTD